MFYQMAKIQIVNALYFLKFVKLKIRGKSRKVELRGGV